MSENSTATIKPASYILAITGASGAQYGLRLLEQLLLSGQQVYLMISSAARVVMNTETGLKLPGRPEEQQAFFQGHYPNSHNLTVLGKEQWMSPVASGSNTAKAMVVCPCSSGTLSAIAQGASQNLLERAADVILKERRPLILVHRETPLSMIHLENMLKLTRAGATILPANPGFYHQPQQVQELVDFIVARILDHLHIEHQLIPRWGDSPQQGGAPEA